jgi:NAD(P)-dependent dehydrogenase (short-subunit alcohol dehydrogenase family)
LVTGASSGLGAHFGSVLAQAGARLILAILGLRNGLGESTYSISKAGLIQMTKAMALELGYKGIRVNALCPGYCKTEMNAAYFESEQGQTYIKSKAAWGVG